MAFPLYFLEQLRERVNLVDVISRSVKLERRGSEWIGLCPFHHEKTPSFHVVPDKQFYHCFGCGAHGDSLKFLREHHNLPFLEAVTQLANMAGLEVPKADPQRQQQENRRDGMAQILDRAARWFQAQLSTKQASAAREMLGARQLSEEMVHTFQIGYAPQDGSAMLNALGISEKTALELGLYASGERGTYPFFRHRLIFPIRDYHGRTIAFGARRLREDQPAKYINSPDTELFHKRETLYHLDQAKQFCRNDKALLLVAEGYMDVIALYQAGFKASVAPLGTSLGERQLDQLWLIHDAPILCFDGDAAGERAASRVADIALGKMPSGKNLLFAFLPSGEDPDSLIKSHGFETMQQLLDHAIGLGEFIWHDVRKNVDFARPEQVSALKKRLSELEIKINDGFLKSSYRQYWKDAVWQASRTKNTQQTRRTRPLNAPSIASRSSADQETAKIILATLINHPGLIDEFAELFGTWNFTEHLDNLRLKLQMYISRGTEQEVTRENLLCWLHAEHQQDILSQILCRKVYILAPEADHTASNDAARSLLARLTKILYERQLIADGKERYAEAAENPKAWQQLVHLQQEIRSLRKDSGNN